MFIFGEMCVLSLIYSLVAVCMFCAVRCVIIICLYLLFPNYSTCVFKILFVFFFVLYFLFSTLCILCFFIVFVLFYVLFRLLCCLIPIFVQVHR